MKRIFFIYWQDFRKGKISGQIAILFTLFIAIILLFTVITINIGILSNKKNVVDNAARNGALAMAANLGSWAHYLSEKALGDGDRDCEFAGLSFWGELLLAVIAWEVGWIAAGTMTTLAAIGLAWSAYVQFVIEPGQIKAFNRDSQKLSQKQQITEAGIRTALFQVVNDPKKITDEHDIDEDNDTNDQALRFSTWYKQRLIDLLTVETSQAPDSGSTSSALKLIQDLKNDFEAFLGYSLGPFTTMGATQFVDFLEDNDVSIPPFEVYLMPFLQKLENPVDIGGAGVDVSFWEPEENFDFSTPNPPNYPNGCYNLTCTEDDEFCVEDCRQALLSKSPNDNVDQTRYLLGYSKINLGPPMMGDPGQVMINEKGVIPQMEDFCDTNNQTLLDTYWTWKNIFYDNGDPSDPDYPLPPEDAGGMYENLGILWRDLTNWLEKLDGIMADLNNPDSPSYNPVFYGLYYPHYQDEIRPRIEEFRQKVGGSDGDGGIREIIAETIPEIEAKLGGPDEPIPISDDITHEAFYGWKDSLGWHFVYAQASNFIVPWLKTYTRNHFLYETKCIAIQYPRNNDYNDWENNPAFIAVMRYDQESQPVNLFGKNPSTGNYLFSWKFLYRHSDKLGKPFEEPTTEELDSLDRKNIDGEEDPDGDGVLTYDEITGTSTADKIRTLLKEYSVHGFAKGVYNYRSTASLVNSYEWEGDGNYPEYNYEDIQITLF